VVFSVHRGDRVGGFLIRNLHEAEAASGDQAGLGDRTPGFKQLPQFLLGGVMRQIANVQTLRGHHRLLSFSAHGVSTERYAS